MFELHTRIQTPRGEAIRIDTEFHEVDGLFHTHATHTHQEGQACLGTSSHLGIAAQHHLSAIKHGVEVSWSGILEASPEDGTYH